MIKESGFILSTGLITFMIAAAVFYGCAGSKPAVVQDEFIDILDNDYQYDVPAKSELNRIYIEDETFKVNGKKIWMNGANTPWNLWNDFGGSYNDAWWDDHFAKLHENGVNAVRVWINCNNGRLAIDIESDGTINGATEKHWNHLDQFFETAKKNNIYIMATLLSFDHFKSSAEREEFSFWRNMLKSKKAAMSFAENYTIPFVKRYGDNPWLWSIDLCNEPDWVYERGDTGKISWNYISYFFAVNAAAIHKYSNVLVTVGMAFPKYNADGNGYEGNKVSDKFLQSLYNNDQAYIDFWSTHFYDWVAQAYGVPFYSKPNGPQSSGGWGLETGKPAVVGECPAHGSKGKTLIQDYENAFDNGWSGVFPWTSNGVDGNGGFNELVPATKYMLSKHRDLIFAYEK